MQQKRVRIIDIAEELGLSTATVSNVIHGKTKKISDETVKRVQELIEQKHYIPNMAGILLAQNNSRIIGVVINDHPKYEGRTLEDGFIAASLNALSNEMNHAGYFMMVKTTANRDDIPVIASMWNMDGLILIGFCEHDYKNLREHMHVPFIVYDGFFPDTGKIVNVTIDHYDGGYQVGTYLKRMGHDRVLCLSDNHTCMDEERINGCTAGIAPGTADYLQIPMVKEARRPFYDRQLAHICQYTAVFAVSDFYAMEFIHYVQARGWQVPKDISVIGFDDNLHSADHVPALTTVRQDPAVRAKAALNALMQMKAGAYTPQRITLPVKLMERGSVRDIREDALRPVRPMGTSSSGGQKWNENWF